MKNKRVEQRKDRERYLASFKLTRRKESLIQRPKPTKLEKPTILIVCEGENTEPSYFRHFKLSSATIKPIGEGYNTLSLVNRAIQLAREIKYDQVWCVFDADPKADNPNHNENFNSAIKLADQHKFGVAYSNQAFEYWIILHFDDHQGGGMNRANYNRKINTFLKPYGTVYDGKGNKRIEENLFELLDGCDIKLGKTRIELAIERAKRIYEFHDNRNPAMAESSTTVFRLVEELRKYR